MCFYQDFVSLENVVPRWAKDSTVNRVFPFRALSAVLLTKNTFAGIKGEADAFSTVRNLKVSLGNETFA